MSPLFKLGITRVANDFRVSTKRSPLPFSIVREKLKMDNLMLKQNENSVPSHVAMVFFSYLKLLARTLSVLAPIRMNAKKQPLQFAAIH